MDAILILFCASGFGILVILIPRLIKPGLLKLTRQGSYGCKPLIRLIIVHFLFVLITLFSLYKNSGYLIDDIFVVYSIFVLPITLTFALIKALAFFIKKNSALICLGLLATFIPALLISSSIVVFVVMRLNIGAEYLVRFFTSRYLLWMFSYSLPTILACILFVLWSRNFFRDAISYNAVNEFSHVILGYFLIAGNIILVLLSIFNPG